VWSTARRLRRLGYSRHEILHMLGGAMSTHIWEALHNQRAYDLDEHRAALAALPESWERQRPGGPGRRRRARRMRSKPSGGETSHAQRGGAPGDAERHGAAGRWRRGGEKAAVRFSASIRETANTIGTVTTRAPFGPLMRPSVADRPSPPLAAPYAPPLTAPEPTRRGRPDETARAFRAKTSPVRDLPVREPLGLCLCRTAAPARRGASGSRPERASQAHEPRRSLDGCRR
jgi:hypothetical protein